VCVADVFLKRKKQLEIFLSSPGRRLHVLVPFFLVLSKKMVLPSFVGFFASYYRLSCLSDSSIFQRKDLGPVWML